MAVLTAQSRKALPSSQFALPGKGKGMGGKGPGAYPVDTPGRARAALGLVGMHGTPAEKTAVRAKVRAKFPSIGKGKTGKLSQMLRAKPAA